jgi:hypothetical protein
VIRTPPLSPRNRLAETILAAPADVRARREIEALASDAAARAAWLGDADLRHAPLVELRARRAVEALGGLGGAVRRSGLDEALERAAALFDAGLHFEAHELLEPHWRAGGEAREALQGLIQVAVGYQHLANGNHAGARALLAEGAHRLEGGRWDDVPLAAFAAAVRRSLEALDAGGDVTPPPFPRRPGAGHGGEKGER